MSESVKPKLKVPARYEKATWEQVPASLKTIVDAMPETRKGLFLHGDVGTGKTHIAYAIGKHVYEDLGKKVTVWNSAELLNRIRESFNNRYEGDYIDELMNSKGLLIVDDIGSERLTDWVAEQFYLIVNRKYNDMKPVVFTSNFNIADLSQRVGERVASRIVEMCEVRQLGGEDRRLKSTN